MFIVNLHVQHIYRQTASLYRHLRTFVNKLYIIRSNKLYHRKEEKYMKKNDVTIDKRNSNIGKRIAAILCAIAIMFTLGFQAVPANAASCTHIPCNHVKTYTYTHTNPIKGYDCVIYQETHLKCACCGKIIKNNVEPAKYYRTHKHGVN